MALVDVIAMFNQVFQFICSSQISSTFFTKSTHSPHAVYHGNFAGVLFCGLASFCGLREQIFVVRDD